jgi:predicted AAA+ superfamily ATPase
MVSRPLWEQRLANAWKGAPVVWLTGVRRVGKTTLVRALPGASYVNCDLPSAAARLADPESFYAGLKTKLVVLDEVHQLADPSRLLKIGADTRPDLRIVATGSSTLAATRKFRDSLTGRKRGVLLVPVLAEELPAFGVSRVEDRLLLGGLPEALLGGKLDPEFRSEWLDSYFARDVQELFRVEKRGAFLLLAETLMRQSGGLLDVTKLAKLVGLSRPTVMTYLEALQVTHVVRVLRPFHGGRKRELLAQPKVYGFDTGFVVHARGWTDLRQEDLGQLWEHLVLDTLLTLPEGQKIHFWRDRSQREIDFVLPRGRNGCDALECKWNPRTHDGRSLAAFRSLHPNGRNFVIAPNVTEPYTTRSGGFELTVTGASTLRQVLARGAP